MDGKTWLRSWLSSALLTMSVSALWGATEAAPDFSRYDVILTRKPFVAPVDAAAPQTAAAATSFVKDLKMCAITETDLGIRVGFLNIATDPNKSYYLPVGESEDGIELVDADYDLGAALLKKGTESYWIYMNGQPSAGGAAPVAQAASTAGPVGPIGPGGNGAMIRQGPVPPPSTMASLTTSGTYSERLRRRREMRAQALKVEPPKVTGEELNKQLQEYNLKLIRAKGELGPPLPIPLTTEQDDQLVQEGVLPSVDAPAEQHAEQIAEQPAEPAEE